MKSVRLIIFLLFGVGVMITVSAAQPEGAGSAAALSEQEEEIKEQGIVPSGDPQLARQLQQQEMGPRGTEIERVLQARHPALGTVPPLTRLIGEYAYVNPWIDSAIAIKQQEFQWPYDITSIAISPDDRFIAVGTFTGKKGWELNGLIGIINLDGTVRKSWAGHLSGLDHIAISLKDQCIITGARATDGIAGWQLGGLSNLPLWRKNRSFNSLAMHEGGSFLVIAGSEFGVQIIGLKDGKLLKKLMSGEEEGAAVAISDDGQIIMAGLEDGTVHMWDQNGKKLSSFESGFGRVSALAISPNNQFVAIAGGGSRLELRDMDGAELRDLDHGDTITAIKIGNGFIVTASVDAVRIWDPSTGKQVRIFNTQNWPVIALSSDEKFLAIGDGEKLRIIWVDPNALVAVIDRAQTMSAQMNNIQYFPQTHKDSIHKLMRELRALLGQQNFDKQAVIELVGKIEKEYELGSIIARRQEKAKKILGKDG